MQTTTTISAPILIVAVMINLVFATIIFFASERFRRAHGVTPWRMPSIAWAIIGFLSWLICLILWLVASSQARKKLAAGGYGPAPGHPGGYGYGYGPAPGASAAGPPAGSGYHPGYGVPLPGPAATAPGTAPGASPPGWHPDPGGRHQYRYWDGSRWTEHVSDHGQAGTDPPTP